MSLELLLGPQLRAFRDAGYEVIGVSAHDRYVERLVHDGIEHIPLRHATRSFSLRSDVAAFVELYRIFRRLKPDIVHTHNPKPGIYGRLAARLAGVPLVVNTQHGLYAQPTDRLAKRVVVYGLERFAACFSDVELVQNEEDLDLLRKLRVPERKLVLFGNGVDLTRFDPARFGPADRAWARQELGAASPDDIVIGCVSRVVEEKGIPELVDAFGRLASHTPTCRLAIIGPLENEQSETMASALAAARHLGVQLLGSRDDVDRLYMGMDLFVLPSHREGFPRSVMEAAAMGLPAIASDIRGCRQAVEDGVTGWLHEVRSADALIACLDLAASCPDLRSRASSAAMAKAALDFDSRRQIALSLATYTAVVSSE